jgi:hypothetical protein
LFGYAVLICAAQTEKAPRLRREAFI